MQTLSVLTVIAVLLAVVACSEPPQTPQPTDTGGFNHVTPKNSGT